MTLQEAAANFVVSYLADNIPVLKDFVKPDLERRIKKCYNSALKEWKCKAVRERYEGKDLTLLEDLKQYVLGNNGEVDAELRELLFRWAYNMQSDDVCADYLNSLKEDELLSRTSQFSVLFSDLVQDLRSVSNQLQNVEGKVDRQGEVLEDIKESGRDIKKTVESMSAKIDGLCNPVDCPPDYDKISSELDIFLSSQLIEKRNCHPSFQLMDIDDDLFPGVIQEFHRIEATNDADEVKTIQEIVEDSWNRDIKNHLMIEGEGGIGKTVALLSIPTKFAPYKVPTVYIQLHELKGVKEEETIDDYIKDVYFSGHDSLYQKFLILATEPWNHGPRVLLLLDGFNEITPEDRFTIGQDIDRWANKSGVQIITSSRYDIHTYVSLGGGYSKILLQPLSRKIIEDYLDKLEIKRPENDRQWSIIDYPLMLTLYAQTEKAIEVLEPMDQQSFRESNCAGAIIWNYLQREIWRFRKTPDDIVKCVLSAEFVAPYIAWQMEREKSFFIDKTTFRRYVNEASELADKLSEESFPPHIKDVLSDNGGKKPESKEILAFLEKDLHLFVKRSNDSFCLMHQQFRDALAALHLINMSYASIRLPEEWELPIDYYVMSFVSELVTIKEAECLWEQNRSMSPQKVIPSLNMLELQKRVHNYDFSSLDFSGMDLREISLFPYRVPGLSTLLLPQKVELNRDLRIAQNTFLPSGHSGRISVLAMAPDGRRCISGSSDGTWRLWEIDTGRCIWVLKRHRGKVKFLAISPDEKHFVCDSSIGSLCVRDIDTGNSVALMNSPSGNFSCFAIAQDGKRCVSGSSDGTLCVWDVENGNSLYVIKEHKGKITSISVTPDSKHCITGSTDKTLRIWEIESGKCLTVLEGHTDRINCLAITPDGKRCVSGSDDKTLRVWDIEEGELRYVLAGHQKRINTLAITSDGNRCVSGSNDKTLRVWNIETGEELWHFEEHTGRIGALAITADGKRCVSGSSDKTLRVWDIEGGESLGALEGHNGTISALALIPNGDLCVSGSYDYTLRVWNVREKCCLQVLEGHNNRTIALALNSDEKQIVSGSLDNTFRYWDIKSKKCMKVSTVHPTFVSPLAISLESNRYVCGLNTKILQIREVETGAILKNLTEHQNIINAIAIASDGELCLSGSSDKTICVWDMKTGECKTVLTGHRKKVTSVAITPDGKYCLSGSSDKTVRVWDIKTGVCLHVLKGHDQYISSLAITSDGKRCISGSTDKTLRVWDISTGDCLKVLKGREAIISILLIDSDGKRCVSFSNTNTFCVWNIDTEECVKSWKGYKRSEVSQIYSLSIPNEKQFIYSKMNSISIVNTDTFTEESIDVLPVFLKDVNFTQANVPTDIKEILRQNGAVV